MPGIKMNLIFYVYSVTKKFKLGGKNPAHIFILISTILGHGIISLPWTFIPGVYIQSTLI